VIPGVVASAQNASHDGDGNLFMVEVTVPSGTVASDLTDFPVMVRLSEMPAGFWSHVRSDGGDIRAWVSGGGSRLPCHVSRFDYYSADGVLWVKSDLAAASDTVIEIHYGDSSLTALAFSDANGRDNVWSDYETVALLGETNHSATGTVSGEVIGDPDCFEVIDTSPDINGHEGVTTDGTHFYVFDSAAIRKYDLSWSLVTQNTSIGAGGGNPGIIELGGGCYLNGNLYAAAASATVAYLSVWSASDLSFVDAFDITSFAQFASDYCVGPDGLLYTIRFDSGTTIFAIDPADGSHESASDITLSSTISQPNGITYWRGAFWVASDNGDETVRVETDGTVRYGLFGATAATAWEGLDGYEDQIFQLEDPGATEVVHTYKPYDIDLGGGGGATFDSDARIVYDLSSAGALGTAWTMGCTFVTSDNAQRCFASLSPTTGATNTVRLEIDDDAGVYKLGVWDSSNVWLYVSPNLDPTSGVSYRVNAIYNGTTARHIFLDGGSKTTDSTITAKGSTLGSMNVGGAQSDADLDPWRGEVGFAYCRAGVLSDDWIAAEYDNLSAPATFSTVGAEVSL
jgi:hypothetical protein